ncbi:FixH family protein [Salinarimonas ramus]|uniref:Nitrogen fixation protein FixH n=1 Tax=Salinarimonas ramus TaxID=690164 RepID=A0A917QGX2_9HYPH|nr:FixH family protein [Salinarimonas ramus]GGK49867.1 nitrogen fixation protein FixH [Salinarimonas ramus]
MSSPVTSRPDRLASDYVPGGSPLTGRKVLMIMVAFFGVIFAMNVVLLKLAATTFRGLEVESAYRAGQEYNDVLAESAAQRARAWAVDVRVARRADGLVAAVFAVSDPDGAPVAGLSGSARLAAPADTALDVEGVLVETGAGAYEAIFPEETDPGRWTLVTELSRDGDVLFRSRNRILLD